MTSIPLIGEATNRINAVCATTDGPTADLRNALKQYRNLIIAGDTVGSAHIGTRIIGYLLRQAEADLFVRDWLERDEARLQDELAELQHDVHVLRETIQLLRGFPNE